VKCIRYEVYIAVKGVMAQHQLVDGNGCFREIYSSTTNYTLKMETAHSLAQLLHNLKIGTAHSSETLVTTYTSTLTQSATVSIKKTNFMKEVKLDPYLAFQMSDIYLKACYLKYKITAWIFTEINKNACPYCLKD